MNTVPRTCCLAPTAVNDLSPLVQWAKKAVESDPANHPYLNTLGAVLYRDGQFDRAVEQLEEAINAEGKGGTAWGWLFLAMAYQQLGNAGQARQWLDKAIQWIDEFAQEKPRGADGETTSAPSDEDATVELPWSQRLELEILRREAESLINATGPPASKPDPDEPAEKKSKESETPDEEVEP